MEDQRVTKFGVLTVHILVMLLMLWFMLLFMLCCCFCLCHLCLCCFCHVGFVYVIFVHVLVYVVVFLVTEKNVKLTQGHNRQQNDAKVTSLGSLLGIPVRLPNGIAERNNNQTYIHRGFLSIQPGCLGAVHGEQSLTVLNS